MVEETNITKVVQPVNKDKGVLIKDSGGSVVTKEETRKNSTSNTFNPKLDDRMQDTVVDVDESGERSVTLENGFVPGLIELPNTRFPTDTRY